MKTKLLKKIRKRFKIVFFDCAWNVLEVNWLAISSIDFISKAAAKNYMLQRIESYLTVFRHRKDNYMNFAIMTIYAVIPILTLIILLVIYSKNIEL